MHFLTAILISSLGSLLWANLPQDEKDYKQWQSESLSNIQRYQANPSPESIAGLGMIVRRTAIPSNEEKEGRIVYHAAQRSLLAIPGHAQYYARRIDEARKLFDQTHDGKDKSDLFNEETYGFETLAQLPSAETVKVLGDFLDDTRGRHELDEDIDPEERAAEIPIYGAALNALIKLPIRSKPYQNDSRTVSEEEWDERMNAWKKWYAEIKAGTRTFRFLGDDREYNLSGPIDSTGGEERTSETRSMADVPGSAPAKPSHLPAVGLGVAVCALLAGAWLAFRPKKPA